MAESDLTVQLIGVNKIENEYEFDFSRLVRWTEMCKKNGVEYFEFSHLFTQWGQHVSEDYRSENGEEKKIFGWETDASGEEYTSFLTQFLPQLVDFIKEQNLETSSYFHVSDEPTLARLESYSKASAIVHKYLVGFSSNGCFIRL